MYLAHTPALLQRMPHVLLWQMGKAERTVYLTFDDGPTPGVTEPVLELLADYDAKATFFCIGGNVQRHPELYRKVLNAGHAVGNHTYNHMNGWNYSTFAYLRNTLECSNWVNSPLFRPPYGKITPAQAQALTTRYTVVMWSVLSGDFDQQIAPETCTSNVIDNISPGAIVVFHDSLKAKKNVLYALPRVLQRLQQEGYILKALPNNPRSAN